ncbi:unnamed protein product [Cuscuta campestris]|uniref:Uncharacterized protein n=1 Tax=Cuscuta campestris TaxID=132261 RepID=A0A484MX10_9ASTE|nr:unnamed protein product [Cuscuta campestris]
MDSGLLGIVFGMGLTIVMKTYANHFWSALNCVYLLTEETEIIDGARTRRESLKSIVVWDLNALCCNILHFLFLLDLICMWKMSLGLLGMIGGQKRRKGIVVQFYKNLKGV